MKINKKTILWGIFIYAILCITYYLLFPKYYFLGDTIRCNKITGKVEYWEYNCWKVRK